MFINTESGIEEVPDTLESLIAHKHQLYVSYGMTQRDAIVIALDRIISKENITKELEDSKNLERFIAEFKGLFGNTPKETPCAFDLCLKRYIDNYYENSHKNDIIESILITKPTIIHLLPKDAIQKFSKTVEKYIKDNCPLINKSYSLILDTEIIKEYQTENPIVYIERGWTTKDVFMPAKAGLYYLEYTDSEQVNSSYVMPFISNEYGAKQGEQTYASVVFDNKRYAVYTYSDNMQGLYFKKYVVKTENLPYFSSDNVKVIPTNDAWYESSINSTETCLWQSILYRKVKCQ